MKSQTRLQRGRKANHPDSKTFQELGFWKRPTRRESEDSVCSAELRLMRRLTTKLGIKAQITMDQAKRRSIEKSIK